MNQKSIARRCYVALSVSVLTLGMAAQETDSLKTERFSAHFQATVITQYKPAFSAKYSGKNSLITKSETPKSITSTLFLGAKLWDGASIFINPEIAAGSGLSASTGLGASTNGETYRVSDAAPALEIARIFVRQIIPLSANRVYQTGDINQLASYLPTKYISLTVGKICLSDIFDANSYSHDPRTQFMNWALMSNGAWDYPANTRGYTPSVVLEWVTPKDELRYGFSLVPKEANVMTMNWNIGKAGSNSLEYAHHYSIDGRKGTIRLLSFLTIANMGNYKQSIALNPTAPNIIDTEKNGRTKYGFGINAEQELNDFLGAFLRASWNDGHNETWAFTEIDRTLSFGLSANGKEWKRNNDTMGLACVISGLSKDHRDYLQHGGYGFELGDGNLNYGLENALEFYYSAEIIKHLFVSGDYQFIVNPGYNKDRGPMHVFSARVHVQL